MNSRANPPEGNATTDGLLTALRHQTNCPALSWAAPPTQLSGGFWAEMYTVELADAPRELAGRLVARVMPDPATAAFETAVQRHLTRRGFPVPTIRSASGPSNDIDRAWALMDFAPGQPLLAGLNATTAIRQAPTLLRRLPDLLAEAAATLHQCPVDGLHAELGPDTHQPGIHDFLKRLATQANAVGRDDLAHTAERLVATAPDPRVICHGDLHPFNLLVDRDQWTVIDWTTAVLADPHYDLAFTTLMLANPPLGGPAPVRAIARRIGTQLANRFLRTYQHHTGRPVDETRLAWGHRAHALRALIEIATWESTNDIAAHRGHPWLTLRPVLDAHLEQMPSSTP